MVISAELVFVLGIAASVIVFILKKVFVEKGREVPSFVYTIGVYIVSLVLALVFSPVSLPPFGPFNDAVSFIAAALAFLGALLPILAAATGFATLVYQLLLKLILEKISNKVSQIVNPAPELL